VDTKVRWLEGAVRPTVDWLREFGHQAKVLHALGYDAANSARLLKLEEVQESLAGQDPEWKGDQ
jgi:hypothetical protein